MQKGDITLTFVNGLNAKLLPSARARYKDGNKVNDEIKEFDVSQESLVLSLEDIVTSFSYYLAFDISYINIP